MTYISRGYCFLRWNMSWSHKTKSTFTIMQNPSIELQRKYEAKFILCLVILLHSILQTAPPPPPSVPSKKDTTYNSESFRFGGRCWWPGGAVVSRNILFTNSESRIIGRDFGSLVYYGVAKISLSWVWHRLWLSGSQRHIPSKDF